MLDEYKKARCRRQHDAPSVENLTAEKPSKNSKLDYRNLQKSSSPASSSKAIPM